MSPLSSQLSAQVIDFPIDDLENEDIVSDQLNMSFSPIRDAHESAQIIKPEPLEVQK